jgi:hypothetical protein
LPAAKFIPSKWETVDEEELKAQGTLHMMLYMTHDAVVYLIKYYVYCYHHIQVRSILSVVTTSKWDLFDMEETSKDKNDSENEDLDGK